MSYLLLRIISLIAQPFVESLCLITLYINIKLSPLFYFLRLKTSFYPIPQKALTSIGLF